MLTIEQRPLEKGEILDLENRCQAARRQIRNAAWQLGWGLVSSLIIAVAGALYLRSFATWPWYLGLAVLVALLAVSAWSALAEARRSATAGLEACQRALELGSATVEKIRASRALELEQVEDAGVAWFYDLGADGVLFLRGSSDYGFLDGAVEASAHAEPPWPAASFEIVTVPSCRLLLGIRRLDGSLEVGTIGPLADAAWHNLYDSLDPADEFDGLTRAYFREDLRSLEARLTDAQSS